MNDDWAQVNQALQYNVTNHRQGLLEYQVGLIASSKDAQAALLDGRIKIAEGMDDDGALRLRLDDGALERITAGDVFFGSA